MRISKKIARKDMSLSVRAERGAPSLTWICAPVEKGAGYQGLPGPSSAYQDLPTGLRGWMDGLVDWWIDGPALRLSQIRRPKVEIRTRIQEPGKSNGPSLPGPVASKSPPQDGCPNHEDSFAERGPPEEERESISQRRS